MGGSSLMIAAHVAGKAGREAEGGGCQSCRQRRLGALQRRPGLVTQLHAKADLLQVYGHLYEHRDEVGLVHSLKVCDVFAAGARPCPGSWQR